jgi:hypothetical protein
VFLPSDSLSAQRYVMADAEDFENWVTPTGNEAYEINTG